eukprot:CAMPEP_0201283954 /NCGR_PEP_ID=MMETSP1317-20130820/55983_1 /ASSEMBLY_ACC=CAM_ASM_000770 /TAXON_ID=187299 /ORGANISM="Undescribed Undescribed, Strain Undescribed" /LENGTH=32 /DNA_ID= /DNA_START= /DNA_END= /DNA_ORIENTATION=
MVQTLRNELETIRSNNKQKVDMLEDEVNNLLE